MTNKKGTVIYFTSDAQNWSDDDLDLVATNFNLNRKLCQPAEESDTPDALRLLIQRGAATIDGICIGRSDSGDFRRVGQPMRLFG